MFVCMYECFLMPDKLYPKLVVRTKSAQQNSGEFWRDGAENSDHSYL
jgi:hypothetical protein